MPPMQLCRFGKEQRVRRENERCDPDACGTHSEEQGVMPGEVLDPGGPKSEGRHSAWLFPQGLSSNRKGLLCTACHHSETEEGYSFSGGLVF